MRLSAQFFDPGDGLAKKSHQLRAGGDGQKQRDMHAFCVHSVCHERRNVNHLPPIVTIRCNS